MLSEYAVLCCLAALAGGINAVAGGGTLLTFPALVAVLTSRGLSADVAKVVANGTSTVALFPASAAAVWGYRRDFVSTRHWIATLLPCSVAGGTLGALLVTQLPESTFAFLVPWLILLAASLFTLQPFIARRFGIGLPHEAPSKGTTAGVVAFQLLVGIYGGYFGAGIGILMLASLAMMGLSDIHAMNGLKSLLAGGINGAAVVILVWSNKVNWPMALAMAAAGCVGAYVAAHTARRLPKALIRNSVIAIGYGLALYYFLRG
ncbi:MAG: sulfite exporter TauE/SafE family protein [Pirellulaceae bacterium]